MSATAVLALQDQQARPAFRSSVDLVHFDVSVLDRDRRPVRGLTAADFTVVDDGKPQQVEQFAAIDVPPPPPPPTTRWLRDVSPDVHTNEFEEVPDGRLFVIVIDDALIPADPVALENAKKVAKGVVDRLGPHDRVAVVFTLVNRNAQDFTTDRRRLYAAIDTLVAGPAKHSLGWDQTVAVDPRNPDSAQIPFLDPDSQLRSGSLRTLLISAESLIAAPQRRKALFFISPGLSVDVSNDAVPVPASRASGQTMAIREANREAVRLMKETFSRLAAANVTLYPVDPFGLGGLQNYVTEAARGYRAFRRVTGGALPSDFNWLVPSGTATPRMEDLVRHKSTLDMDFLMAAASNTGGRALVNTNEFDTGLDAIFQENGSYYLIGYSRPAGKPDGYLHKVTVRVKRPDVIIRTRSGYEAGMDPGVATRSPDPARSLQAASAGPVANNALPLQLALAPVAMSGSDGQAKVVFVVGMRQPPVAVPTPQTLRVRTHVFTTDGITVGSPETFTAELVVRPGTGEVRYEALTERVLKPGRYTVRVSVHRASDGLAGSVYSEVVVPDFRKAPLTVSGVLMQMEPGVTSLPRDGLPGVAPFRPTATRDFDRDQEAVVFFRLYQNGGAPLADVPISVRIVNERDEAIASATGTVGADRFRPDTRAAEHHFRLPLVALEPGRYLLRFDLGSAPSIVTRDVIIRVR